MLHGCVVRLAQYALAIAVLGPRNATILIALVIVIGGLRDMYRDWLTRRTK